ncbi:MAG: protease HtpX [Candidatus Neptunochlamydia sp.]|nr:protease HtpX [Candidatus Neptunochlamydia sp.]
MFKRIFLFLAVNCLVILTISAVLSLLNVKSYLTSHGLDLQALLIFCLIWGMVGALISLALSRKMAKWMMRIQLITPSGPQADLYHMVARLARDGNLPDIPEVGIFDSPQMNAFATGPTKRRSLVAVSTGLIAKIEKHELEAVLAHEISHISNGDMVTMTLIQGVVNAFVMFLARVLAYAVTTMGRSNNHRSSYMSYYLFTMLFEVLFMILGSMVVCAFSRWREFRADRGGAILTRKKHMIAALERLRLNTIPPSNTKNTLNALMISPSRKRGFLRLFATHPPLEIRIQRLRKM